MPPREEAGAPRRRLVRRLDRGAFPKIISRLSKKSTASIVDIVESVQAKQLAFPRVISRLSKKIYRDSFDSVIVEPVQAKQFNPFEPQSIFR